MAKEKQPLVVTVKRNKTVALMTIFVTLVMPIIGWFGIPLPATKTDIERLDRQDVVLEQRIQETGLEAEKRRLDTHIRTLEGDRERYILQKYQNLREQEAVKQETGNIPQVYISEQAKIESKLVGIEEEIAQARARRAELERR